MQTMLYNITLGTSDSNIFINSEIRPYLTETV